MYNIIDLQLSKEEVDSTALSNIDFFGNFFLTFTMPFSKIIINVYKKTSHTESAILHGITCREKSDCFLVNALTARHSLQSGSHAKFHLEDKIKCS